MSKNEYINIDIEVPACSRGTRIKKEKLEGMSKEEQQKYLLEIANKLAFEVFDYKINIKGWEE